MLDAMLEQKVPTAERCATLLQWLEDAYDVSLKFWISVEVHELWPTDYWLLATGSGDLFDSLPLDGRVYRSRVLQAQGGDLYHPLWACLVAMESDFSRVENARVTRPSL